MPPLGRWWASPALASVRGHITHGFPRKVMVLLSLIIPSDVECHRMRAVVQILALGLWLERRAVMRDRLLAFEGSKVLLAYGNQVVLVDQQR